jgi:hypothetical protein
VETKTVKIQILRTRFFKYSELIYNKKPGVVTVFFEREILDDDPILYLSKFELNLATQNEN